IFFRVSMMIPVESLGNGLYAGGAKLQNKILRTSNSTKNHRPRRNILRMDSSAHAPYQLAHERKRVRRCTAGEHNRVRTAKGRERFAKPSSRKQTVLGVLRRNQYDVEIPRQGSMLETIVQQMQLRPEPGLGKRARSVAIFANDDGHLELACDEERLVPELLRQSGRLD